MSIISPERSDYLEALCRAAWEWYATHEVSVFAEDEAVRNEFKARYWLAEAELRRLAAETPPP